MARTAGLIVSATLILCLLPLFPDSVTPSGSSKVAATNSPTVVPRAWIDVTVGILPGTVEELPRPPSESAARPDDRADLPAAPVSGVPATESGVPATPAPPTPPGFVRPVKEAHVAGNSYTGGAAVPRTGRTWEAARAFLKERGIERFRLETIGEPPRYRFTCWVPLGGNRYVTRQFVGEGESELDAMWRALDEVAAWEQTSRQVSGHADIRSDRE